LPNPGFEFGTIKSGFETWVPGLKLELYLLVFTLSILYCLHCTMLAYV